MIRDRLLRHPLLQCGFRPFFLLTAASAVLLVPLWLLALSGIASLPDMPGGPLLWHAHELLFGFGGAAIAGFVLTAVPEFTGTRPIERRPLALLVLLWLAARLSYLAAGWWPAPLPGLWPAALCNLLLWTALLRHTVPALWRDPTRRHIGFAWTLGALALLQAAFFLSQAHGGNALAWLQASVGAMMILIVIAASRISMSIVNGRIESSRPDAPSERLTVYLARPPRRALAIFAIGLCSALELLLGAGPVAGWAALAAAAAMLNLLNDWHVGRPLFTRWSLMLYACYWLMALGHACLGLSWLGTPLAPSAGRHLLMAGAMGLSIFVVMCIAGRIHAGQWLDRRAWLPLAACAVVLGALLRALAGTALYAGSPLLLLLAAGAWSGGFAAYLWHAWSVLAGPRTDGRSGCAGAGDPDDAD